MNSQTKKPAIHPIQNSFLPILNWLPGYERVWLRGQLLDGLNVLALHIPEILVYARIATIFPQTTFCAELIGLLMVLKQVGVLTGSVS